MTPCMSRHVHDPILAVQCMHVILLMLLAENNLASKVGGEENLEQLQYLKGLLDPENLFRNHQLRGLTPGSRSPVSAGGHTASS